MKVAKFTGKKWDAAQAQARKAARAKASADTPGANNVPALRAAIVEMQKAFGIVPAASK